MSYFQSSKMDDKSELTGSATNFFGAAGIGLGRFLLLGKYIFQSTYAVSKKDDNGEKATFSKPEGAFAATLVYRLGKRSFINVEYNSITYGKMKSDGTTSSLSSGGKMQFSSVGLSYGMMF